MCLEKMPKKGVWSLEKVPREGTSRRCLEKVPEEGAWRRCLEKVPRECAFCFLLLRRSLEGFRKRY